MAKKIRIFSQVVLGFATAATLSFAAAISPAHACEGDSSGQTNCAEAETVPMLISPDQSSEEDTYSETGSTLKSEKSVPHSYFQAGYDIATSDAVDGIHFVAGNIIDFSGSSEYGAFVGNSLKINGSVKKDLFIAGSSIEIGEDAAIGRDVYATASSVIIKANLNGNVFISGNRLVLENITIDGDVTAAFSEIVVKGKVSISGNFKYNNTANITGLENLTAGSTETYASESGNISFATSLKSKLISLLGRLLATIVLIAIAGKFTKRLVAEFNFKSSWKYLGLGLALLIGVPLAAVFVMVTIVGLPLGLIGVGAYILFTYLSSSVTGLIVGDQLAKRVFKKEKMHPFLKATIGITLLTLLSLIPYVGSLISAICACFGFGYLVRKVFRQPKTAKK